MNIPFPYHRTPTPFCPECPDVSLGTGVALFLITMFVCWLLTRTNRNRR